jgi:hypothetical protein
MFWSTKPTVAPSIELKEKFEPLISAAKKKNKKLLAEKKSYAKKET